MPCIRQDPPRLLIIAARDNKRDKESGIREGIRWDCRVPRTLFLLDPPQKVWQPGGVSHISIWSRAGELVRRIMPMDERGSEVAAGPMYPCK